MSALRAAAGGWPARWGVPLAGVAVGAAAVVIGAAAVVAGGNLGTPSPPFLARWDPAAAPAALIALAVLMSAVLIAPLGLRRPRHPGAFALAAFAFALALGMAVGSARGGLHALYAVFQAGPGGSYEAHDEYLPGLPALAHGSGYYIAHFASLIPYLPVHVRGNPPGPLIALHALGIDSAPALAALCIGVGALSVPLTYALGRSLGGEARGRTAAILCAFSPALLLFGVTSMDYVFATLGLVAGCLLTARAPAGRLAGALAAAVITFFSWLLFAVPVWAVLVAARREGRRAAIVLAAQCAAALAVVYGALVLGAGYDPVATLRATLAAYRHGISAVRPYAYWVIGSPAAWGIALGLPVAWAALRACGAGDPAAVALGVVVLAAGALGATKAETERIWLPFVPLACVGAAAALGGRRLRGALALLAIQTLAVQLLFDTVW